MLVVGVGGGLQVVVVGGGGRWCWVVVVVGSSWRPREATEASTRVQILAWPPKSSPVTTPPGPLKLRLCGEQQCEGSDTPLADGQANLILP